MKREGNRLIRASGVGLYAYCARAWWLGRVEGYRPMNEASLADGEAAHRAHGRAVIGYHRLRQTAYALLALALLVSLVLLAVAFLK